jgi:hypothetical protein
MTRPLRLQLSRKKGFDLQEVSTAANGLPAAVISRPSKWGNPYPLRDYGRATSLALYRTYLTAAVRDGSLDPTELRGRNLACWCKPYETCHGDILLEFANSYRNN